MFTTFLKSTIPKVNILAQLEIELVFFEVAVQHSAATVTFPISKDKLVIFVLELFFIFKLEDKISFFLSCLNF